MTEKTEFRKIEIQSFKEGETPTEQKVVPVTIRHMKNGVIKFYADAHPTATDLKLVDTETNEEEPFTIKSMYQKVTVLKVEGVFEKKFEECPDASRYELHYVAEVETEILPVNGDGQPMNASPIKQSVFKKIFFFVFAPILSFFEKRKAKKEKIAREKFLKSVGRASEVMKRSDQMAVDEFGNVKIINKPKLKLKRKA